MLKLDKDKSIHHAYHGTRRLNRDQIETQYPAKSVPFEGHSTPRFWSLTTYFETTFVSIFVHLVDWADENTVSVPSYETICQRIYDGVFWNFADYTTGRYV